MQGNHFIVLDTMSRQTCNKGTATACLRLSPQEAAKSKLAYASNKLFSMTHLAFAGHMHRQLHQNGAAYYASGDDHAQNDDVASAATEGNTEDDYADSANDPPASRGMPMHLDRMQNAHSHYAPTAQDSYDDEHSETSSEGTR